jgi:hypothetical protein
MHTEIWRENPKEKVHFKDLGADLRITLKSVFKKYDENVCTGFIWLQKGMSGRLP